MFNDQYVTGQRRSFLWPVNVWRVLYPETVQKHTNIFQQTILALARAKLVDPIEIASLLGLTPELVVRVVSELQEQKRVDRKGYITAIGIKALDGEENMLSNQKVGYAFQDAISGEILPRFAESLPEIEPISIGESFPEFLLDRAKGWIDRPFCINAPQSATRPLEDRDLIEAYKRYRTDCFNAKLLDEDSENTRGDVYFNSIECIDQASTAMYLWGWIYRDEGSEKAWLCSDPFGLRHASSWMRGMIERVAFTLPPLSKLLSGLFGLPSDTLLTTEILDKMDEKAHWDVIAEYPWAARVVQYERYLPAFVRQRMLVESRDHPNAEQLDGLLTEAQKLAEGSMQWMLERWPASTEVDRLPQKRWSKGEALNSLKSLNLEVINGNILKNLAEQELWPVRNALKHRNASLRALLFAALLTTNSHPDHPLHVAGISPTDLEELLSLAASRNKAGHASGRIFVKTDALRQADIAMQWIKKFKEYY